MPRVAKLIQGKFGREVWKGSLEGEMFVGEVGREGWKGKCLFFVGFGKFLKVFEGLEGRVGSVGFCRFLEVFEGF